MSDCVDGNCIDKETGNFRVATNTSLVPERGADKSLSRAFDFGKASLSRNSTIQASLLRNPVYLCSCSIYD